MGRSPCRRRNSGTHSHSCAYFSRVCALVGQMTGSSEYYRAQAELCSDMAASASNDSLTAEWLCLSKLWLSMVQKRAQADEVNFDPIPDSIRPAQECGSPGASTR